MRMEKSTEMLLLELKLHGIRENMARRLKETHDSSVGFEEFLSLILQDELDHRRNARIKRLLKTAAFRQAASLESLDLSTPRGIDKKLMADLCGCRFIRDGLNILVLGATGVGKTFLASAIGNAACRSGYSTLFFRMNTLIEQTTLARAKGTYLNLLRRLTVADLLILDDFGIKPLLPQQYQDLYDILDERSEGKSTIITSQLPVANWSEVIADPVSCEAISDRLASRAIKLDVIGPTQRLKRRPRVEEELDMN